MIQKLIFAPDSFKGTISSVRLCQILEKIAKQYLPGANCVKLPIADGGEGLVEAMILACGGESVRIIVQDPLGRPVEAAYGLLPDGTAVIEMAAASGLPLLKDSERNPLNTSSYGTGELIRDAVLRGCRRIILGLGGSATNDGGMGAATALGFKFNGETCEVPASGRGLQAVRTIDVSGVLANLADTRIMIACDVKNPFYGPMGAANIYGPQKGANPEQVSELDRGLENLARVIFDQSDIELQKIPGSGAAGGLAAPFLMLGQTTLQSGVDLVLDAMAFDTHLADCDLVVTGEGRTDRQSAMGKVLSGISQRAAKKGVSVISISGALEKGSERLYEQGMTAMFATCRRVCTLSEALVEAESSFEQAATDVFRLIAAVSKN
jgi:glycerate kinase